MHLIFNKNNNNIDIKLWNSCIDIDINSDICIALLRVLYYRLDFQYKQYERRKRNETTNYLIITLTVFQ
jgi:hypothetical protein